jgi:arsenite oxidase small subunit
MPSDEGKGAEARDKSEGSRDYARRNFLRAGLAGAVVLLAVGVASITGSLWSPATPPPEAESATTTTTAPATNSLGFPKILVGNVSDLKVSEPLSFNYPLEETPNILVKLGVKADGGVGPDGDIVAFSSICQHLGCIWGYVQPGASPGCDATYKASGPLGYCCCHGSVYDLVEGAKVTAGPTPRPQPQVILEFDSSTGDIYATGMTPPTIFGHNTGSNDVTADLSGGTPVT